MFLELKALADVTRAKFTFYSDDVKFKLGVGEKGTKVEFAPTVISLQICPLLIPQHT